MKFPILLNVSTNEVIKIDEPIFRIGREKSFVNYMLVDEHISRAHCEIITRNDKYYVKDLSSCNGTYLDNLQLGQYREYLLKPYSILQLSNTKLLFLISESEEH